MQMLRHQAPIVLDEPMGPPATRVLLDRVTHIEFRYFSGESWAKTWARGDTLPRAVRLKGKRTDGAREHPFRLTVWIPASEFFSENT